MLRELAAKLTVSQPGHGPVHRTDIWMHIHVSDVKDVFLIHISESLHVC